MNSLRNSVQLIGNLGKDPEMTTLEKGKKITRATIATNESYKSNNGDKVTETQWHNLVAWDAKAEFMEKYLKKGNEVIIKGRISNRSYEDKSGVTKYISEIIVSEIVKLTKDA
ncbi:MAG: single-stranded DNA-binding protein [Saprospiraceae bacterium]|uniref:Single-stranded DNA-binding protein n=1 Tax=Candidatus Defluviibacterium haderslevense TaxID=2981993 RepID=A0A9D7XE34_9BACT|nr:single-stranded DNA-binding protein [Candidatus Defluviibacterium haderslevense]MBL0238280.1 single-stranded DNA-binding protein [Candidatus Defluviibacterium haderslevense]